MKANKTLKTFLTQFITGGLIIGTTSIIAQNFGSKWAALFWSIPFSFLPVLIMLYKQNGDWENYISYSMISSILLILTFISMTTYTKYFGNKFYVALLTGLLTWIVLAAIYLSF